MLLAGCGGGDDYDDGYPPGNALDRAAGFYEGVNASNRYVSVIVIEATEARYPRRRATMVEEWREKQGMTTTARN